MALAPGPTLPFLTTRVGSSGARDDSPGPSVSASEVSPLLFLPPTPKTIFIACALGGPYPEPNFSWAGERSPSFVPVLSLCIFSTLYTGSSRAASIFYTQPNSNKAVTKVPNPVALFCPCTRVGGRAPSQVYMPKPAFPPQSQKIDQEEVDYVS